MSAPFGKPDFRMALDELRILASKPGEDAEVIAACDRLHHLIDRQGEALHAGGTAAARRWRTLRMQAEELETQIADMAVRTDAGRRATAEVALRLVPEVPRLMVLARAALHDLSRLGLDEAPVGSDVELLTPLHGAAVLQARACADLRGEISGLLDRAGALSATTAHGRRAKARALLGALEDRPNAATSPLDAPQASLALSLARDVLGETSP